MQQGHQITIFFLSRRSGSSGLSVDGGEVVLLIPLGHLVPVRIPRVMKKAGAREF